MTVGRINGLSGAVLKGGASSRMGRDKASLVLGGVPFAARIARLLDAMCCEVLLVGGSPVDGAPGRAVGDPEGPRCALRGLVAALAGAAGDRVLVVATDLPLVTDSLLRGIAAPSAADAVVPRPDGRPQPLCAVYRRAPALERARERLASERLSLQGFLEGLSVEWVDGQRLQHIDPDGTALVNINTADDLERARALFDRRGAGATGGAVRE